MCWAGLRGTQGIWGKDALKVGQVSLPSAPALPLPAFLTPGMGMEGELPGGGDSGTLHGGEDQLRQWGAVYAHHQ